MKYLVTGGFGFIGSHLIDKLLLDRENSVVVIDDLSEGITNRLDQHKYDYRVKPVIKSILDNDLDFYFQGIDVVFHLAALPRPQLSIIDPKPANKVNVEGTLNVLIASASNKVKRLVFASSGSVYGEQEIYPFKEDSKPKPMSPYGLHKVIGEEYCALFERIYGLETNCMRFFNAYGPRMNPKGEYASLIPKFIEQINQGITPTIYGDGTQARDFCHVSDIADALIAASHSKVHGEIFNVGNGINYSVNHVSDLIVRAMKTKIRPVHGNPVIEPTQTLADISKAVKILNWQPKVTLEEGIVTLIQ